MKISKIKKNKQKISRFLFVFFIFKKLLLRVFSKMYSLYDENGILRFVNSDKQACLDYAELFELNSSNICLINLIKSLDKY